MKNDNLIKNTGIQILFKALTKFLNNDIQIADSGYFDQGFYVDIYSKIPISTNDFAKIEKCVKSVISSGDKILKINNIENKNKYQKHIEKNKDVYFLKIGNFSNYSYGETLENVNKIKFFKLINVGGSYWLNNSENDQLTRVFASCFDNEDDFDAWNVEQEEIKSRDHRKIGQQMEIFYFDNSIGQGLPIWLPNGEIIKKEIKKFLWDTFEKEDFHFVDTPILGSKNLYITSGHWDHYKENNFPPITVENETFMLRPMTCPHHINVYNSKPRSYRELPFRICEDAKLHRYESSGGLIGLERVRAMELFDCHVVTRLEDIEQVISQLDRILKLVHKKMEIRIDQVDLSLHDPDDKEKYHDDEEMWKSSENQLRSILENLNYDANEMKGEAAFYGPKIDYQVKTNLGKIITISTIQLDFLLPQKFNMEFIDESNSKSRPVLIHFGVIGTYERFIATLLSQTKGILPLWLAPQQITIIPINTNIHLEYCKKINKRLRLLGYRTKINDSNERMNRKIRESQTSKIPYLIVVGDSEMKDETITFRKYSQENSQTLSYDDFVKELKRN